jgi:hypothetical protein
MPLESVHENMNHLQSADDNRLTVSDGLPVESKKAWSVAENDGAATRLLDLGSNITARAQDQPLTVHCAALSDLIKDIIKVYPGCANLCFSHWLRLTQNTYRQNLTGNTLVFQQPYAALMHHMTELEAVYSDLKSRGEKLAADDAQLMNALTSLLEFLRPKYQACYVPAQARLSQEHPTVTFDDIWVLFKPNSLAYAKVDDQWIGCKIGPTTRLPVDLEEEESERWHVGIWYLQTDFSSEEISCATRIYAFDDFDGELDLRDSKVVPCQIHDGLDGGTRRKTIEERGKKVLNILWDSSRQYSHSGKSLLSQSFVSKNRTEPLPVSHSDHLDASSKPMSWLLVQLISRWVRNQSGDPDGPIPVISSQRMTLRTEH